MLPSGRALIHYLSDVVVLTANKSRVSEKLKGIRDELVDLKRNVGLTESPTPPPPPNVAS